MHSRCNAPPSSVEYAKYVARGIRVCARWSSYENFLADMGRRPTPQHSLDREDNDGNYEPDNCRWATRPEQCRNRRSNRLVNFNGKLVTLVEAMHLCGLHRTTFYDRVRDGWPEEDLFKPRTDRAGRR